ncbi:unnamed protein product [Mytilus edulis]|uniref:Uncharacterized protein n=1 Tax=Mytilus edulis TaxID=6550 RepID=A0A8S3UZN1_MYTED|nr:unnamed protein product [Mytilus edulis]
MQCVWPNLCDVTRLYIRWTNLRGESRTGIDFKRLEKWWAVLEGAVLGLASRVPPVYYEKSIKENIDLLKNFDLTENNIRDIIVQITADNEKFQDRLLHQQNNNFNRLLHEQQEQSDALREVLTHRLQQHEDHQDSQLFSTRPSSDHETTRSSVTTTTPPNHQAIQSSSAATMSSDNQAAQSALGAITPLDHEATQSSSKATSAPLRSIDQVNLSSQTETTSLESHTTQTTHMETDNMNLEGDRSSLEDSHIQCVEWRLANPPNTWKVEEIKTTLTQMSALLNQWFKRIFKISDKIISRKIVEVCNIDSGKPEKIQVDFTVKNRTPEEFLKTDSTWIKQEDICASPEKQDGVQCPNCHKCFCCKQCDEKQEKIKHLEKYNNEIDIDLKVSKNYL